MRITIPKSAANFNQYLQLTSFMAKDSFYHTKAINSGSSLKTGMLSVNLEVTGGTIGIGNTEILSQEMNIENLTDPIEIEIPYSTPVNSKMVLSCVYSKEAGDTILSDGITTFCSSTSCN